MMLRSYTVTQAVRYRPVRSLLLLGLLVLVSLFVLFTLSQMAVVQHTMMAHLGTGVSPGLVAGGGGTTSGGRASKGSKRPWRRQFNQFKIEPLLVRNAPSVEVNSAMAANRRMANQIAAIIVRNSLLVSHSSHSKAHNTSSSHHVPSEDTIEGTTNSSDIRNDPPVSSNLPPEFRRPGQKVSSTEVNRGTASQGSAGGSGGQEDMRNVTDVIRTKNKLKGSLVIGEENVRHSTTLERQHETTKSEKVSTSTLKDATKPKVWCDPGASDCSGQNSALVQVNNNIKVGGKEQDKDSIRKATNSQGNYEKQKNEPLNLSKTHLHDENLNSTDTERKLKYLNVPDISLYEAIDDDDTDLAFRKNVSNRKGGPSSHLSEDQLRDLPLCPEIPPGLKGHLHVDLDYLEKLSLKEVLHQLDWVSPGGSWSPVQDPLNPCLPRHKVAIVLPYRDRLHHLIILLSWLHPILRRQQLEYSIYVAEQTGNATFNKGSIMNAGFVEAWQRSDANCFVFHDVDLLPEDDRNMYSCPPHPRHLSVGVDTLGYKLPYFLLVGGVLSVRGDQFLRLNGYSNMYWGWGGEDDDMGYRIRQSGLSITRPADSVAKYTMIRHLKRRPLTWKVRGKLLRTSGRRYRLDGLNTLKYTLQGLHRHPLFTHLLLDVGTPPENLIRLDSG
ncbi:uncharacterized protein LOC123503397 isoform X2 [Portunus trituberculatus]|uniref:uncharacterized protein LOC123503397 isoform X2 n=1 Tax=Portunus trituberculatus TaxID=210409 RepID=UPI001E1D0269|nr:uncharacterized protein LOC123503397 isoform X2 [Portunus trituberculatus]XP_045109079.1 uncharacterized protein LOC123503397 isoform X2 [Portunus trituberculatus]